MTSLYGFSEGNQIFETDRIGDEMDYTFTVMLPDDPSYDALTLPVEFRLYGFQGQYGGHPTSLFELRLDGEIINPNQTVSAGWKME